MISMYEEIMRNLAAKQSLKYGIYNEGDYYKEIDGYKILYCKECNHQKQQIMFIGKRTYAETLKLEEEYAIQHPTLTADEVHKAVMNTMPPKHQRTDLGVVGVPCQCQLDYIEGRKKQEKSDERRARIKENVAQCYSSSILFNENYSAYGENKFIDATKRYASKYAEMKENGKGLILCGQTGAGKTVAVICMANDLLNREVNVRFKVQQEIIYEAQSDLNNKKAYLDELTHCGLLIIDDFNLQVIKIDSAREILFYIIDARNKMNKPVIITTNHSALAFKDAENDANKRIFERLGECCYIVENNKHNYRKERLWAAERAEKKASEGSENSQKH